MRVLADQIASRALSEHNQRPTTPTETMATNPKEVTDAMWHRSALNTNDTGSTFSRREVKEDDTGNAVSLDEVMLHQNRILHNEDGFEREQYLKETILEEGGSSSARRDSLGSPSDTEGPTTLDAMMMHQNRILHNEDGFAREDYETEKSSSLIDELDLLVDEGSTIYS